MTYGNVPFQALQIALSESLGHKPHGSVGMNAFTGSCGDTRTFPGPVLQGIETVECGLGYIEAGAYTPITPQLSWRESSSLGAVPMEDSANEANKHPRAGWTFRL